MMVIKSAHTRLFFFIWACALFFVPSSTYAENIELFRSEIAVSRDAKYTITETIEYVFTEEKHGMYRCIPTEHGDGSDSIFKRRYIDISFKDAKMDGEAVPYTVEESKDEVCMKIGDANSYLSGEHTYSIFYTVEGAVSYTEHQGVDLYWNVTGDEWTIPIRRAEAVLTSSDGLLLPQNACYFGKKDDFFSCTRTKEGDDYKYSSGFLSPGEELTVSQALDQNKIAIDVREEYNFFLYALIGTILSLFGLSYLIYRHRTEFKTDNAIIPQYEPYPDVKPMYMGILFDGNLDPKDISAGFVYLAERGYIKIRATQKKVMFLFEVEDFEVSYVKSLGKDATPFEKELLKLIFGSSPAPGHVVSLSDIKNSTKKGRENAKIISKLRKSMIESLQKDSFYTTSGIVEFLGQPASIVSIMIAIFCIVVLGLAVQFILIIPLIAFVVLARPRRSRLGYEAVEYLEGFKDFLSVTEKERYVFHNAPQKSPEQFMEFLPYAIAFGVEEEWAKVFEDITIPVPDWYEGSTHSAVFSATHLTQSLSSFSQSLATSGTTSSSSGGGSAGGGSGGGGGGSW